MKKEMIGKILLNYTKIKILNLTLMSLGEAGVRFSANQIKMIASFLFNCKRQGERTGIYFINSI